MKSIADLRADWVSVEKKIWKRAEKTGSGCWQWTGALRNDGYANTRLTGRTQLLHRTVYQVLRGEVDRSIDLDHLCRNRGCFNPDHLDPVPRTVNIVRGKLSALREQRTHCRWGHPLDEANSYQQSYRRKDGSVYYYATCLLCQRTSKRASRWRQQRPIQANPMSESRSDSLVPLHKTRSGFWIAAIHYSQRPDFDYEAAIQGMDQEAIRSELEIDWLAGTGLAVYPTFRREVHVASRPIEWVPSYPLYLGWDWGLEPACALSTINSMGQWCLLPSFHPEAREFEGVYSFAEHVAEHLIRKYAEPHGITLADLELIHHGDPAGRAATPQPGQRPNETLSAFQVLNQGLRLYMGQDEDDRPIYEHKRGWGWHVIPGAVSVTERLEAVKGRLSTLIDGLPGFQIDPREEFGISAFLGGYSYKQFSDGRLDRHPNKNHASHVMNGWEYTATRCWMRPGGKRREEGEFDEDTPQQQGFVSQASGSSRY